MFCKTLDLLSSNFTIKDDKAVQRYGGCRYCSLMLQRCMWLATEGSNAYKRRTRSECFFSYDTWESTIRGAYPLPPP